ncbi:MAG: hypothetical protein LBC12_05795 [Nitrososphaerota archaeon]|nr:hypothetical protein [Nitrososphaerota archaeon]
MKLEEIKNNKEIMAQLRWDLNPQSAVLPVEKNEESSQAELDHLNESMVDNAGAYFYVDVWNRSVRLALMIQDVWGYGRSVFIEKFDSPLLEESIYECGGAVNISGGYPINGDLEVELKKKLGLNN